MMLQAQQMFLHLRRHPARANKVLKFPDQLKAVKKHSKNSPKSPSIFAKQNRIHRFHIYSNVQLNGGTCHWKI
jgi:hypothetical protein